MNPIMKRVKTGNFVVVDEKIYRLYRTRVTWADGETKDFDSEEHAKAFLEDREPKFVPFKTF